MTVATIEHSPLPDRMEYARVLADSALIPQAFRKRPADVLVAIEYGNALGIAPIVALSEINVINGTPSLSASLMAALARQAGHRVRVTGDATHAVCTIIRADDPGYEHTATWSEAKARAAGLWGKGHWSKDPGTMLRWRAISECVRMACSEVLGGLKYTPEEVADFAPQRPEPTARVERLDVPAPTLAEALAEADDVHDAELVDADTGEVIDWPATVAAMTDEAELRDLYRTASPDVQALVIARVDELRAAQ